MSGRPGPDEEGRKRPSPPARRSTSFQDNGTEKRRALPPRPPGTARIDQAPTRRIARPQRQAPPRNLRKSLLIWGCVFLVCALLACGIGYAAFNYINALNAAAGPSATAVDFISALKNQNYDQAFTDLSVTITLTTDRATFTQQAKNDDHCYGAVTDYTEVSGSAQNVNNTWSFSYTLTRSNLKSTYQLHLQLKPDPETPNTWRISSFGDDLGPARPSATCK